MKIVKRTVSSMEALEARIAPATIYGVDDANHLISFDSKTPGTIIATTNITGLTDATHEVIKGIDFRPADGKMYALGILDADNGNGNPNEGRIYTLNTKTGALTQVGNGAFFSSFQENDDFSFDINPAADRIRIQTDRDDNIRVNPNTGTATIDTDVGPTTSAIVGLAYDRNFEGAPTTTLFGLDQFTGNLVKIGGIDGNPSPNGGVVSVIGATGLNFSADFKVGFDIESHTGIGYAVIRPNAGVTGLYTINLTTGAATLVHAVGDVGSLSPNPNLNGMTVALPNDLTIVNATSATYIDQDGDTVSVKITGAAAGASLSADDFTFSAGQFGSQLKVLDLSATHSATPTEWAHASISIQAVPTKIKIGSTTTTFGDSFATVGYINATGVDLGKVTVNGDLGQIDAGDATTNTMGLAALTVQSMGVNSNSQLPSSALIPNQISDIVGKLGSLTVKSDFTREQINVTGGAVDGAIGNITIGGDIVGIGLFASSGINSTGPMGNITIGGSIFGGSATSVGSILAQGTSSIGNVTIGGSIYGGDGSASGLVEGFNVGNVTVKGSVIGGTDDFAGGLHAKGVLGNVTVGGSLVGGQVPSSNEFDTGIIYSTGTKIGNVKIGGSLIGTIGSFSGSVFSSGSIGTVTIGGSLEGRADGPRSAEIQATGSIGAVKIAGDMNGGTGLYSGSVVSISGSIASVTVSGNVTGNGNTSTGIIAGNQLGAVKITGSLESASAAGVRISGQGLTTGSAAKDAKAVGAIASVNVTGSVRNALILGGYSIGGTAVNPDATIGAVTVGGNWIGSSLVAGVVDTNADGFGNADDVKIAGDTADTLISKIGAITIKGFVAGTPGTISNADHFGFIAEQIASLKIGVRTYTLATGTDLTGFGVATTNDVFIREVA